MSERHMLTLEDVLTSPTRPDRDVHLFLPADRPWALSAPALVVDFNDGDEEPEDVERRTGFRYVLPLSTVGQITANARRQLRTPTPGELLRAFLFYYNCDAFIDLTRGSG